MFSFQELGLISSEIYYISDNSMKHLIKNDLSMGGKLVLADGDPHQLSPVTGSLIWISNHIFFSFDIMILRHYVRSSGDSVLQSILEIMRKPNINDNEIKYIAQCIQTHCQFVNSWDDLPDNVVRTVSKKVERIKLSKILLIRLRIIHK